MHARAGLSYTEFGYSGLAVVKDKTGIPSQVTAKIENAGKVAGAEVAQLYLGFPAAAGEPPKVRQLRHHFGTICRAFSAPNPPHAVRAPWSPSCPC